MICGAPAGEDAEDAELDALGVTELDGYTCVLSVDDGGMTLDEGTLEEEAMLLDVICMIKGVLDPTLLLCVAVAVQYSCGATL